MSHQNWKSNRQSGNWNSVDECYDQPASQAHVSQIWVMERNPIQCVMHIFYLYYNKTGRCFFSIIYYNLTSLSLHTFLTTILPSVITDFHNSGSGFCTIYKPFIVKGMTTVFSRFLAFYQICLHIFPNIYSITLACQQGLILVTAFPTIFCLGGTGL